MIDCKKTIDTLREVAAEVIVARFTGHQKDEALESAHGWLIAASVVLEEVARERDAAVYDLTNGGASCDTCTHAEKSTNEEPCCYCLEDCLAGHWQWRGPCAENGGAA